MSGTRLLSVFALLSVPIGAALAETEVDSVIADRRLVREKLEAIRGRAAAHESHLENLRVRATLDPGGDTLEYVVRDGICRHDRQVTGPDGVRRTGFWLDDGITSFSFTEGLLVLSPTARDRVGGYYNIATHLWMFAGPSLDGDCMSVSRYCELMLRFLDDRKLRREMRAAGVRAAVRVVESPSQVGVILEMADDTRVFRRVELSLDPTKHLVMVGYVDWESGPDGPDDFVFETSIRSTYREIEPGVFFLQRGDCRQVYSGARCERAGITRESRWSVQIDEVAVGDISVADGYFDVHQWPPIRHGIDVHDTRVEPPREFVFNRGSFDSEVLRRAAPLTE